MHSRYNRLKANALSDKGKSMARARWTKDRAQRDACQAERMAEMREIAAINLPRQQGDFLGTLQWTSARTGKVTRWVIRIGDRSDRLTVEKPGEKPTRSHGWTWFFAALRKHFTNKNS